MIKSYILLFLNIYFVDAIEVQISNGRIEGKEVTTNNTTLHLFKRIPFAQPPLGHLRFQRPQPVNNWTGTLNATEYGDACLGIRSNSDRPITMSEDCLNINVFTSHFCLNNGGCPVFVMIHGGVFAFGNSIQYNDTQILEKFVKHDIIFVLPAMRVGFFGFADFGDDYEFAPYNVGLYDIIANLEWVQQNIHNFGGNSSRVTLMGYSAGGVTTQYMISSPQLQDRRLFSRAMISSGLPMLAPEQCRNVTDVFTQMANCSRDPFTNRTLSIQQKLRCLRKKSANELNELTIQIKDELFHFGPQTSRNLLPARNYLELATHRKPLPLLVITALNELENVYDTSNSIRHVCTDRLNVLNLYQAQTINECVERYNDTAKLSSDFYHAIAALECRLNSQNLSYPCYLGVFAQVNHSNHANDMLYMVGQHLGKVKEFTINDMLMDDFYPQVVRNFVNGQQPSKDWLPTNKKGKGYLNMNFNVLSSDNKQWPEFVQNEWYEEDSVSFFLDYLFEIERNASKSTLLNNKLALFSTKSNNSTTQNTGAYNNHSLYHRLHNFILLQTFIIFTLTSLLFIVLIKLKQRRSQSSHVSNVGQYEYGAI